MTQSLAGPSSFPRPWTWRGMFYQGDRAWSHMTCRMGSGPSMWIVPIGACSESDTRSRRRCSWLLALCSVTRMPLWISVSSRRPWPGASSCWSVNVSTSTVGLT